jgi:integrase
MPKRSAAILSTDRQIAGAPPPAAGKSRAEYRIEGTPNLILRVTPEGTRSWVYRLKRPKTNSWSRYTIGQYPTISLARARDEAVRLKRTVLDGGDPIEARDEARHALSMRTLGEAYIKRHAKPKKRSWHDDERKLEREVYPPLGHARADQVTKTDLVGLLNRIHDRGAPVQANRTLALLRKLFNWAVAEGYLNTSPALGIPSRAKEQARTRTLTPAELVTFWRALDDGVFEQITADALRMQLLLGARVREITGMARTELALDAAMPVWTLPKARAKAGRDVPRPLPPLALSIVRRRLEAAGDSPHVFASPIDPSQPLTARAPSNAVRRAGEAGRILRLPTKTGANGKSRPLTPAERAAFWRAHGFTPHDLRRTCRTYLAKLGVSETVAKKILGHAPPQSDVTASVYDQHTYLPEMRRALELWENHLLAMVAGRELEPNVINLRAGGPA